MFELLRTSNAENSLEMRFDATSIGGAEWVHFQMAFSLPERRPLQKTDAYTRHGLKRYMEHAMLAAEYHLKQDLDANVREVLVDKMECKRCDLAPDEKYAYYCRWKLADAAGLQAAPEMRIESRNES